jgi:hypothetical protein
MLIMGVNIPSTPTFLPQGYWVRPRRGTVKIENKKMSCQLDTRRPYELTAAYRYSPHIQLLKIENDEKLLDFVRCWGPIALGPLDLQRETFECPVSWFWVFRERLSSLVFLLAGLRGVLDERTALGQFLDLRPGKIPNLVALACYRIPLSKSESRFATWLSNFAKSAYDTMGHNRQEYVAKGLGDRAEFAVVSGPSGGFVTHPLNFPTFSVVSNLLSDAPIEYVRKLYDLAISHCLGATAQLQPVRARTRIEIAHSWKMDELRGALEWMVFMDEWNVRPIMFCPECQKPFHRENNHQRKYCGDECGHRVRARNSRRRQLAQIRLDCERKRNATRYPVDFV